MQKISPPHFEESAWIDLFSVFAVVCSLLPVQALGAQRTESLSHLECLNEAENDHCDGDHHQQIQLARGDASQGTDECSDCTHDGKHEETESIEFSAQDEILQLFFIETSGHDKASRLIL